MKMDRFFRFAALSICMVVLTACSPPVQPQPVLMTATPATATRAATASPTLEPSTTPTHPNPTETPPPESTETVMPPPAGVFRLMFYPPLVMPYDPDLWMDESEYENTDQMINFLRHKRLETCTIGVRGPSGFYPDNMKTVRLGTIDYQVFTGDRLYAGKVMSDYFAVGSSGETIENETGIPIMELSAVPSEVEQCTVDAEKVFANLRGQK